MIEQHGRLDILVNNAGVTVDRPILSMTVDDWHKVLRVNLSGAFYMSKPALEHMKCLRQRRRGQRGFRSSPWSSDPFLGSVDRERSQPCSCWPSCTRAATPAPSSSPNAAR